MIAITCACDSIAQDLIILKNGDEIKTRITKVTSSEIEYKIFSVPDAPAMTISNSEVLLIKYESGAINLIEEVKPEQVQSRPDGLYYDGGELASAVGPKYFGLVAMSIGAALSTDPNNTFEGSILMVSGSIFYTVFQIIQDIKTARLGHAVGDLYELERRRSNQNKGVKSSSVEVENSPTIEEVKMGSNKLGPLNLELSDKLIYTNKKGISFDATLMYFDGNYYFINYIVDGKEKSNAIYPSNFHRLKKIN